MMKKMLIAAVTAALMLSGCGATESKSPEQNAANGVDVDLSVLSQNMVYAQVYTMMTQPEEYVGKRIRAKGTFAHVEENGRHRYAVYISDAAACCAQGLEFECAEELSYPEDLPNVDDEIMVEGVFDRYEMDGWSYFRLTDADLTTL